MQGTRNRTKYCLQEEALLNVLILKIVRFRDSFSKSQLNIDSFFVQKCLVHVKNRSINNFNYQSYASKVSDRKRETFTRKLNPRCANKVQSSYERIRAVLTSLQNNYKLSVRGIDILPWIKNMFDLGLAEIGLVGKFYIIKNAFHRRCTTKF